MVYIHPWDDYESELLIVLRTSGMHYKEALVADFKDWSYTGLRAKYLRLLDTSRWEERRRRIEKLDEFERLEVICLAQLAVAHSRLQQKQGEKDMKAQGWVR